MKTKFYRQILSTAALSMLFLSACDKNEDDFTPIEPVEGLITATLKNDYSQQVFVDLSTGNTKEIDNAAWDIAFDPTGLHLRTNNTNNVSAAITDAPTLEDVTDVEGLEFKYDNTNGDLDMTAIGEWEVNTVYVFDFGRSMAGEHRGYKKLIIKELSGDHMDMEYADLDGANEKDVHLDLNSDATTYFSLMTGSSVDIEPKEWDLLITGSAVRTGAPCQAMGPAAMPGVNCDIYRLAATVLNNRASNTAIAIDNPSGMEGNDDPDSKINNMTISDSNYDEITNVMSEGMSYSKDGDAIGRSWNHILTPHSDGKYKVYDFITYVLTDQEGKRYKLRFHTIKNPNTGEIAPSFEYEELLP
ncbi:HmuY family protein [Aureibacter tunicatorum]|uniref:HmuY protein n=1 Tax=Aureibacter tunicatorum TaxID=866807 RepID=A0AAE4BVM0_9BACT|nr:HmuY family protein [Aureibacter tunicatorum]MDR6242037.1 hypothetical protein [Aureibacter tunicatorum]BDD07119.1 hypothetical protein AUTU_46020 [Aureibacter tunicatorum]